MLSRNTFIVLVLVVRFVLLVTETEHQFDNDEIRYRVIEELKSMCPRTSTCTSDNDTLGFEVQGSSELPDATVPCCGPCRCDADCGEQCCPDKPDLNFTLPERELKHPCILAQYRPYRKSWLNGRGYRMIAKCASNANKSHYHTNCDKSSFDVDISDGLDILPVTSKATGETYKNRSCAFCNHEYKSDLIYWEMHFICSESNISIPSTREELSKLARNNRECNIFFNPVREISNSQDVERCGVLVDRCNLTGNWAAYDRVTDMACNSYTSVFYSSYKNIHCYLCNEENATIHSTSCDISPVTATGRNSILSILDFNRLTKQKKDHQEFHTCPAQHKFDRFKKICRRLSCSGGLIFNDGVCAPMFQVLVGQIGIVYEMTLALHPLQNATKNCIDADSMKNDCIQKIKQVANHMGLYTFGISSFIKLKTDIVAFTEEMFESNRSCIAHDIDYIAVELRILEGRVLNVSERIEQITNTLLTINASDFMLFHRNITSARFLKSASALLKSNITLSLNEANLLLFDTYPEWLKTGLSFGYDEGGYGIIPLQATNNTIDKDTVFHLVNDPLCPKFVLKVDDFSLSFHKGYLYITDTGGKVSRSDLSFSENGDYVSVCHNLYLYLVERYAREHYTKRYYFTRMTILTIVCTSLSLISLGVTLTAYCILRDLRNVPGLNNMGLVISLIGFMSLTLANACVDIVERWLCRAIGVTLHFSLLSSFGWMFICTFHMAKVFTVFSKSSSKHVHISKTFSWYVLVVELSSIFIVVVTIIVSHVTSEGENIGYTDDPCFVDPSILRYNVAIPIATVVIANFAMYLFVIITISRIPDVRKSSSHERNNIIIFVKLSTFTGMTWVFGFIYQLSRIEAFAYIFTVLNASQGVFIMCSFVVNKRVYDMCRPKRKQQGSSPTTSMATTATHTFAARL